MDTCRPPHCDHLRATRCDGFGGRWKLARLNLESAGRLCRVAADCLRARCQCRGGSCSGRSRNSRTTGHWRTSLLRNNPLFAASQDSAYAYPFHKRMQTKALRASGRRIYWGHDVVVILCAHQSSERVQRARILKRNRE